MIGVTVEKVISWFGILVLGVTAAFGKIETVYQVLIVFVVLDTLTGVLLAWSKKELSTKKAQMGMLIKGGELILVGMSVYLQKLISGFSSVPLPEALAGFYIYVEGLSIITNASALGVPIPSFLKDALAALSPEKNISTDSSDPYAGMKG